VELWRQVNRAAYAQTQATFSEQRARLAAQALAMLSEGADMATVRAHLDSIERGRA
jgi:hypothetical protein